jgi:hypothetical protein
MLPQMIAAHLFHERHVHLLRQQGIGASCGALISTLLTWDYQIHVPCTSEKKCGPSLNTLVAAKANHAEFLCLVRSCYGSDPFLYSAPAFLLC